MHSVILHQSNRCFVFFLCGVFHLIFVCFFCNFQIINAKIICKLVLSCYENRDTLFVVFVLYFHCSLSVLQTHKSPFKKKTFIKDRIVESTLARHKKQNTKTKTKNKNSKQNKTKRK